MKAKPYGTAPDSRAGRIRRRAWALAQRFVRPFLRRKFNYACSPIGIEGPFLLIANHANNTDPLFVGLSSRTTPLTYVASEHLERLGLLTGILTRYFSVIPRAKASSAVGTVRSILKALRQGEAVALFAEGECTWDGRSVDVFPATGKLVKSAGVPLVTYRLEGNYLSCPRWARKGRRGRCVGAVVRIYSPEELAKMKGDEITAAINRDIFEDAWQTQKRVQAVFRSKAPAEGLEQALFLCPDCSAAGTLRTKGSAIFCTKCGMRAELDEQGFFRSGPFPGILEWDRWQRDAFSEAVRAKKQGQLFPGQGRLTDLSSAEHRPVRFHLDLAQAALVLDGRPEPFAGISGMAMVKTNRLLFTTEAGYYELRSKGGILRPYLLAWEASREINDRMENER